MPDTLLDHAAIRPKNAADGQEDTTWVNIGIREHFMINAWSFLTFGEDRQYGGNAGYEDDLQRVYKYDSKVPNHKQVAKGDLAILRGKRDVYGFATITSIIKKRGVKVLKRCPECNSTSIRYRPSKNPHWRCDDRKHEFEKPHATELEVDLFEAGFGGTFIFLNGELTIPVLREISVKRNDQLAIQRLNIEKLEELVKGNLTADRIMLRAVASAPLDFVDSAEDTSEFTPSMVDQREKVLREIRARRGQRKFRNEILKRFGGQCVVSGCKVQELLEAAHILPYRGEEYNHPSNGLLLRTDLHTLFDLGLIKIEPQTLTVCIADSIQDPNYSQFNSRTLIFTDRNLPSMEALQMRWES